MADGGTLFLDEIGDCPPDLQTRLLRVLDQGEIRRVGDNTPRRVDVRIIAATHHDLERDVAAGRFRKDLFFRLSVFTISPPPLRERREDVPLLVEHFLERLSARHGKRVLGVTPDALARLQAYDFPGNVRELQNELERAVTLADPDGYLTADLLSDKFAPVPGAADTADGGAAPTALRAAVERFEAQFIADALARHGGNQSRTAVHLGLSRRGLIDKLQRYGITRG